MRRGQRRESDGAERERKGKGMRDKKRRYVFKGRNGKEMKRTRKRR